MLKIFIARIDLQAGIITELAVIKLRIPSF